jgi:hypothetical protein
MFTKPSIFISYRRADTGLTCDRVADYLGTVYGLPIIFRDLDHLVAGEDFRVTLHKALRRAKVAVVLIGPQWLSVTDAAGQRRLDAPEDYVRLELETLLRQGTPVFPLLVQGAPPPVAADLPATLTALAYVQMRPVRAGTDFRRDMQAVVADLTRYVPLVPRRVQVWRRLRNGVARATGAVVGLATLLLTLESALTWFHHGLDLPLLSGLAQRLLQLFGR